MKKNTWIVMMLIVLPGILLGTPARGQTASVSGSAEDIKAIEALVHSNPSDHVTEDVSFTNIFGTVRFGREEFIRRHLENWTNLFQGDDCEELNHEAALRPTRRCCCRCCRRA